MMESRWLNKVHNDGFDENRTYRGTINMVSDGSSQFACHRNNKHGRGDRPIWKKHFENRNKRHKLSCQFMPFSNQVGC